MALNKMTSVERMINSHRHEEKPFQMLRAFLDVINIFQHGQKDLTFIQKSYKMFEEFQSVTKCLDFVEKQRMLFRLKICEASLISEYTRWISPP